ncbi:MAG TPA: DUF58 domain-containing protein [Vicinamibacteria bacterium]|nr:DUF58 domain-containing protein [Vicinamibacteria bacterium]
MKPGPLLLRLLGLLCLLALLVPVWREMVFLLVAGWLVLLGAALAEWLLLRRIRVEVSGPGSLVLSLGEVDQLTLRVQTSARRSVRLSLRQVFPRLVDEISVTRQGLCWPGETLSLAFPLRGMARGRAPLSPVHMSLTFLGLAERLTAVARVAELTVVPDLLAVRRLHQKLNAFALRGFGARISARLGKGREFDRLREHVTGDEFRDIAWKASARHGKLITREYRLDRAQDILVAVDRGHRMQTRVARLTKLDHAVNAAVLLAYLANRMEDKVGVLAFATEVDAGLGLGRGSGHLRRFTELLASVADTRLHTDYLALGAALKRRLRHRTLIVILTALPELEHDPLLRTVRMLAPQHLPLLLVLTDPDLEAAGRLLPADKAELSRTLAARDLLAGREQTVRELRRLGALVVETAPGDAGVAAMNAYIDVKRRQLL